MVQSHDGAVLEELLLVGSPCKINLRRMTPHVGAGTERDHEVVETKSYELTAAPISYSPVPLGRRIEKRADGREVLLVCF